ncbi:MAG: glycosyltransferase family 2 protein [Pseudolabrys sp.]
MPGTSTYFFRSSPHSACHFRLAALQIVSAQRRCKVGGWDPHNVTEDADLGMRLARFGYRSGVIPSSTYKEAPADVGRWVGQRTRWLDADVACPYAQAIPAFPRARIR